MTNCNHEELQLRGTASTRNCNSKLNALMKQTREDDCLSLHLYSSVRSTSCRRPNAEACQLFVERLVEDVENARDEKGFTWRTLRSARHQRFTYYRYKRIDEDNHSHNSNNHNKCKNNTRFKSEASGGIIIL